MVGDGVTNTRRGPDTKGTRAFMQRFSTSRLTEKLQRSHEAVTAERG